ncbi:MAG: trypsin-like peptidase domain-containing protein [Parcubacteria group bacterium]|nr:trypsin-like peptidase domain-containing protein [Parcubacteria group bacterium]
MKKSFAVLVCLFVCLLACLFLPSRAVAYEYSLAGVDDAVMREMIDSSVSIMTLKETRTTDGKMRINIFLGRGAHFRSCVLSAAHVISGGSLDKSPPDKIYLVKSPSAFWEVKNFAAVINGFAGGPGLDGLVKIYNEIFEKNADLIPLDVLFAKRNFGIDAALLKIRKTKKPLNLPSASFGKSGELKIGHAVYAIGAPFDLIVSARNGIAASGRHSRNFSDSSGVFQISGFNVSVVTLPGDSGSPIFALERVGSAVRPKIVGVQIASHAVPIADKIYQYAGIGIANDIDSIAEAFRKEMGIGLDEFNCRN